MMARRARNTSNTSNNHAASISVSQLTFYVTSDTNFTTFSCAVQPVFFFVVVVFFVVLYLFLLCSMLFLWGPPSGPKLERAADARSAIVCAVLFWVNGDDLLPYSNARHPSSSPFSTISFRQLQYCGGVLKVLMGSSRLKNKTKILRRNYKIYFNMYMH